ncbi:MAG: hypothetical protein ABSA79_02310 [Candidatus Bathyarchaeia archaeon]
MPVASGLSSEIRRKKRTIGIIAIALILLFTVLAIAGDISFIAWIIADLVVALIANLLLRRIGRVTL